MVREGIMLASRTHLHVFEKGTVNAVSYRDEVLEPYTIGYGFILMDDTTRSHRAYLIDEFLESEDIRRTRIGQSDLIPIDQGHSTFFSSGPHVYKSANLRGPHTYFTRVAT
ncbi:transposable element Tcb2 transposase [Trichonephila clavipes]|nr:transposable element Tcb2 transposase [Trichonephila clavipes]